MKNKIRKNAFTFIEICLVVALLSLVSLIVYRSISGGFRIWNRNKRMVHQENIYIFLDKISNDLRNSFQYSKIPTSGSGQSIIFPTIVYTPADKLSGQGVAYVDQVGSVEYTFNSQNNSIYRRQSNYGQAVSGKFGSYYLLADDVKGISFYYYYSTPKGVEERTTFKEDILPEAVKIDVNLKDANNNIQKISRFINIPIG